MKKLAAILLTLILLVSSLPLIALAEDTQDTDTGRYVDIVVIVDHSDSMMEITKDRKDGTDRDGNRFAAAAMIAAMADMNGSRMAVITFDHDVDPKAGMGVFVDLSDEKKTKDLITLIENTATSNTDGGTDYGAALAYAYNLFENRDEETKRTNRPMIILLTDGANNLYRGKKNGEDLGNYATDLYLWNKNKERYQLVSSASLQKMKATDSEFADLVYYDGTPVSKMQNPSSVLFKHNGSVADLLVEDVVARCIQKDIRIYTIPLYSAADSNSPFIGTLDGISSKTGALSLPISAADASELPNFFGQLFADQIGSKQRDLHPTPGKDGYYTVDIPIFNSSVQEANIYIPLDVVDEKTIELRDSDNIQRRPGTEGFAYMSYNGKKNPFVLYKLRSAKPGIWTLKFKTKDGATASDIKFSLLYNYDLTLVSEVSSPSVYKSEHFELVSQFLDNKTHAPSADKTLYTGISENDEKIIFTYTLLGSDSNGNPIPLSGSQAVTGEMRYDEQDNKMKAPVELDGHGLKEGAYWVQITAEGAGLVRETMVPINLKNQAPVLKGSSPTHTFKVEVTNDPETSETQSHDFDLNDYVIDHDGDTLRFTDAKITNGDAVTMAPLNGSTLHVQTVKGSDGHFKFGTVKGTVEVTDGDTGFYTLDFMIIVNSEWASALNAQYVVTTSGMDGSNVAAKNDKVSFSMVPNGVDVDQISGELILLDDKGNEIKKQDMTRKDNALVVDVQTENKAVNWTANLIFYKDGSKVSEQPFPIIVKNTQPKLAMSMEQIAALFPSELTFNASIYSAIFPEHSEETIDLTQIFTDADHELGLTYEVTYANEADRANLDINEKDGKLTLKALGAGNVTFTITATDGDNKTIPYTHTMSVVDLFMRWTIIFAVILAIIIAIILLIKAIHQHNKPRFPNMGSLHVTIGNSLFDSNSQPDFFFHKLRKPKDPVMLDNIITMETSDTVQFKHAELSFVRILPIKKSTDLRVEMTKKPSSYTILLDDNDVKVLRANSPLILSPNHQLALYRDGDTSSESCVHISYSLSSSSQPAPEVDTVLSFSTNSTGITSGADVPMMVDFNSGMDAGFSSAPSGMDFSAPANDVGFGSAFGDSNGVSGFGGDSGNADFGGGFGDSNPFSEN